MWIVAVAWIYVVALMAATEPNVVAGIMTFFGYCVLPLSILFYLTGGKRRRARRALQANAPAGTGPGAAAYHGAAANRPGAAKTAPGAAKTADGGSAADRHAAGGHVDDGGTDSGGAGDGDA
jgi:hypothetical protein